MGKIKTSSRFSYDWVTPETRADFEVLLAADGVAYAKWRHRKTPPAEISEATFRGWWNSVGPTAFATPEDAFRYRRELWAFINTTNES